MPLSQAKLNDIWHSGFCAEAVVQASTTEDYDSDIRVAWLKTHIETCNDCRRATVLKGLEEKAARITGGEDAVNDFYLGREAHNRKAVGIVILDALQKGIIDAAFMEWMRRIAERAGKEFRA